ncbi:hypothetical protein IGI04_002828 [Brassica rapa subsp. trilocularis]|uniref:Uncharacterized protein n=1 Tax=Brassica rapa subsp. trilocularis TaxID=1813537 RepID=A0ABQ7NWM8_BRACM|nr:hypothetical protein IGI04_002828 [Brassica rapa subsp. trilocularis]
MATCSGGSERCLHRSFAQPSRSKKSDRNQKYVDDSSPETVLLRHFIYDNLTMTAQIDFISFYELGGLTIGGGFTSSFKAH